MSAREKAVVIRPVRNRVSVHHYATLAGVLLAALGLGGVLGLWYVKTGCIILYLITAAVFFCVSFLESAREECRVVVGGLGALYVLSGCLLAIAYELAGVPSSYYLRSGSGNSAPGYRSLLHFGRLPSAGAPPARSSAEEEHPDDPD